ncbi:MAG: beta-N-acetylhexosaminidase [Thermoleophilaceae bacterium]|nr:beta-N-acetylhexosaminidase [Thermoleophilaceae bacterium]
MASRLRRPPRRGIVADLNSVPPLSAAAIVFGFAIATMLLLALIDSAFGGGDSPATPQRRAAARQAAPPIVDLGSSRYPSTKGPKATPAPSSGAPAAPAGPPAVPLRRLVGEKLLVRMSGTLPSPSLLRRVRKGQVGGVVLFADNIGSESTLRYLTQQLQSAAKQGGSPGILIAVDQEGGIVKRLSAGPPSRSAPQIGATGSTSVARSEGSATGRYLNGLGINVDLAPVFDTPAGPGAFIANRAFGTDPGKVGRLASAFSSGLGDAGVAATAKHFPGLGSATTNTDEGRSVISPPFASLQRQLKPFAAGIGAGIPMVMMSTAIYPGYEQGVPAAFSHRIVSGVLRGQLGFQGVVVTDDLETPAVRSYASPAQGAVAAARAGVDIVLLVRSEAGSRAAYSTMMAAAKSGQLKRSDLEASHARIEALKQGLAAG